MTEEKIRELMLDWTREHFEVNDDCKECTHFHVNHRTEECECDKLEAGELCPEIVRMANNVIFTYE